MGPARRMLVASATVLVVMGALRTSNAQAQTTALFLDSQPGDYIGQGQRQTWTAADLTFTADTHITGQRVFITASTAPNDFSTFWNLRFIAPEDATLGPAVYENALRAQFQPQAWAQLDVSGDGRGCNVLMGRFIVYEVEISNGTVTRFAADFEQHCGGQTPALFGAIRLNSSRDTLLPFDGAYPVYSVTVGAAVNGYVTGPGIDCGAGRIDCDESYQPDTVVGLTPVPLDGYVFLGWAGDCLAEYGATLIISRRRFCTPVFAAGPGRTLPESPDYSDGALVLDGVRRDIEGVAPDAPTKSAYLSLAPLSPVRAVVKPSTGFPPNSLETVGFRVAGPGGASFTLIFGAPAGTALTPGDYEFTALQDDPASPSPVLSVGGEATFCKRGSRFRVYEYVFDTEAGSVGAFAADFDCGPGLDGSIRYRSTRQALLPFDGA